MKARLLGIAVVCVALISFVGWGYHTWQQPAYFSLAMLDVGQGDSLVLRAPTGETAVIDAGKDATMLAPLGEVLSWWQRDIDLLVLTHPDLDHIGGAGDILRRYDVQQVLMTGVLHGSAAYEDILQEIARQQIPVTIATSEVELMLGEVQIDVLWPRESRLSDDPADNNATSVVLRARYGDTVALLTGDIHTAEEEALLATNEDLRAQVLKLGHHGADTSTGQAFLDAVQPDTALISAGADNSYGHPHEAVIDRLTDIQALQTAVDGTVVLTSDGTIWRPIK